MKGLQDLPSAQLSTSDTKSRVRGDKVTTEVTLRNTSQTVAFFQRASLRQGVGGAQVTPATWSDNYVTLWPGKQTTLTAEYRLADLGGKVPHVQLSGWNTPSLETAAPLS